VVGRVSSEGLGNPPWEAPARPPRSTLPSKSDIVIVGAGLTGLSAAVALSGRREVVVLEEAFGSGATSRSGGVVLGGTLGGAAPAFAGCELALRDWIGVHGVDCGLVWAGCLELVRDESRAPHPIDWQDGGTVRLSARVEGGVVDPARLLGGLLSVALRAGVRVVDEIAVHAIEQGGGEVRLATNRGTVVARRLVMATDAMLASQASEPADPWSERGVTVAMQTLPLGNGALDALGLRPDEAFYTDDLPLLWGRVMPDRSLLVGREFLSGVDGDPHKLAAAISAAGVRLVERARGLHPASADVALKRVWGGPIAWTKEAIPLVCDDPALAGVTWAGGYGGHGIAQAFRVGRLVAERLLDA